MSLTTAYNEERDLFTVSRLLRYAFNSCQLKFSWLC